MAFKVNSDYVKNGLPVNTNGKVKQAATKSVFAGDVVEPAVNATLTAEAEQLKTAPQENQSSNGWSVIVEFLDENVARPVTIGAKWIAETAKEAYSSFVGLFNKTNETTQKINEDLEKGDTKAAAKKAEKFLTKELGVKGVNQLDDASKLSLYQKYLTVIDSVGERVKSGELSAKQALELITGAVNEIFILKVNDERKAVAAEKAQEAVEVVINEASVEQASKCPQELIKSQNAITVLAGSITNAELRATVLARINTSNDRISNTIAFKLNFEQNGGYAAVFISGVQVARTLFNISCDLTETVVKLLTENRTEQNRLDVKAAEKKAAETAYLKKEDEKYDIKKNTEKKLQKQIAMNKQNKKKLEAKLDQILASDNDNADTKKIIAEIINPKRNQSA